MSTQLETKASIAGPVAEWLLVPSGLQSNRSELKEACAHLQQWGGYTKRAAIDETIRLAHRVLDALLEEFPRLQAMALWIYRHPNLDEAKIGLMERQLGFPPHTGKKSRGRLQEPEGREWLTLFSPTPETFLASLPAVPGIPAPWGVFEEEEIVGALEKHARSVADAQAAANAAWLKKHCPPLVLVESGR